MQADPLRLSSVIAILIGWLLRLALWGRYPFRADEAIYSYWALHFWQVDPFFLQVWPDKPPLFLVALAAAFQLWGANQVSAQWLNIAISTLTIPVVAVLGRQYGGARAGLVAALAFALNPFAISFAATAYTDPLLVLAGLLACYFAHTHRPFWAGLWLALAIMTKQQGLLYVPLVAAYIFLPRLPPAHSQLPKRPKASIDHLLTISYSRFTINYFLFFSLGLALITLPILYWDSLRWAVAPSPWDLSIRHYGTLTLLPPSQWAEQVHHWLPLLWQLTASGWVWIGLLCLSLCYAWLRLANLARPNSIPTQSMGTSKHPITQFPTYLVTLSPCRLVSLWGFFFLLAHLLTSVQPWDRYLLPLAPVVALGIGGLAAHLSRFVPPRWGLGLLCAGLLFLIPPARQAASGQLPIGGDHGAYTGLSEALAWVQREQPPSLILYQRVLGWHYRFYLYDQMTSGAYDVRWFSNPVYLAANAAQAAGRPRLLIEPSWATTASLAPYLAQRGLWPEPLAHFGEFTIYRLAEQQARPCRWCYCGPRLRLTPLTTPDDPVMMSRP